MKVGDTVKILSERHFSPYQYRRNRTGSVTHVADSHFGRVVTVRPHYHENTISLAFNEVGRP